MKKLIIALASIAIAVVSEAASVDWSIEPGKDYQGQTAYIFAGTADDISTLLATVVPYDESGSSAFWSNGLGAALASDELGRKGAGGSVDGATVGQTWTAVVFDGDIDVGTKYTVLNSVAITDSLVYTKPATPSEIATFDTVGATGTLTMASPGPEPVPEPTSGLLLILGMAGLALRRKLA